MGTITNKSTTISAFGATLVDDAAASNARTTLGLVIGTDVQAYDATLEIGATADQTDAEIETAYNTQVTAMSQATAEAGTSTTVERVTAQRMAQAIAAQAGGGLVLISTATASTSASITFTGLSATYAHYLFEFEEIIADASNIDLWMRTSTDGGSTYDSAASSYWWQKSAFASSVDYAIGDAVTADTKIVLSKGVSSGTGDGNGVHFTVKVHNPTGIKYTSISWQGKAHHAVSSKMVLGHGWRVSAADVDAVQFLFATGNILSGKIRMYGVIA
jgi:hypothetical protein